MSSGEKRGRGRPRRDEGGSPLSKAVIVERALAVAAADGFGALTMRRLADELTVTVRALYNHVADRQEVIDGVAELITASIPPAPQGVQPWDAAVAAYYRRGRETYRKMGRAALFALDETVTTAEVPVARISASEDALSFFVSLGLSLADANVARGQFLLDQFAYALLIDHTMSRMPGALRDQFQDPVPRAWLDARPDVDAPLSRAALDLPRQQPDFLFEEVIARAVEWIGARRAT